MFSLWTVVTVRCFGRFFGIEKCLFWEVLPTSYNRKIENMLLRKNYSARQHALAKHNGKFLPLCFHDNQHL